MLSSQSFSPLLPAAFSPFYSVILESRGTIDSPVLPPGYQSKFCTHRPEGWAFLVSHFFFLLVLFLRKPMVDYLFRSALVSDVTFLMVQLLAVLPLCLFSQVGGIPLYWFESFLLLLYSGSPRYRSFALWEVTLGFLLFFSGTWEGRIYPLFLVFFWLFLWAVLILSWLCYTPRGSRAFGSLWGSRLSFFTLVLLQSFDLGFFSFFFFLFSLAKGLSFYFFVGFWASSLLGLPPLFIFYGPLCYFFGPGCCDFLDLNMLHP